MPAGPRPVSRRTTLAVGAVGTLLVTGCDGTDAPAATPTPGVTPTAAPSATPAADPDADLVETVLRELTDVVGLVSTVAGRFPRLAGPMGELETLHAAHIAALEGTPPTSVDLAGGLGGPGQALGLVRTTEKRLQRRLVESSVRAESGSLARLLASMSAAVTQRLVTLPGAAG